MDWDAPHVPGELIVQLPPTGQPDVLGALSSRGGEASPVRSTIPQLGLALVRVSVADTAGSTEASGASLAVAASELVAETGALWAEPNYTFALDLIPNDPYFSSPQASYLNRLEMPAAWDITTGDPRVLVAVVDTGMDIGHPDLQGATYTNSDEIDGNGLDDDNNGFVDDVHGWDFAGDDAVPDDDHGHGTHVAGIVSARTGNGIGIAGMAQSSIMPVDVFTGGIGTYEDLIQAIVYATDNGARVINLSLGASSYSRGEEAAVDYAWSHGVIVVAAAGNTYRNTYHYPAAHPNAIAVAATDANDQHAAYSTWGEFVDVAAPGSSVYSTYRGSYAYLSGTSMAAPHVSGLAALILSLNPGLEAHTVRDLIESQVDDLGAPGLDPYLGHGRVNARKALQAVPGGPLPPPTPPPPTPFWPPNCQELIADGNFETASGAWQTNGAVSIDSSVAYSGTYAAHFVGGPSSRGVMTQTVSLPPYPLEGAMAFAFRIESSDNGWGQSPGMPFDDWFTLEFRSADGELVASLLRTGNTADIAPTLPWDRYLYLIPFEDLARLRTSSSVELVFVAQNDGDAEPTSVWVDSVRFCARPGFGGIFPLVFG